MKIEQKEQVIDEMKTELTIKAVCQKLNISRQTIYRWIEEDENFSEELKKARLQGIKEMNDECENSVVSKIRSGDSGMIKFWLRFHHDDYKQQYIIQK